MADEKLKFILTKMAEKGELKDALVELTCQFLDQADQTVKAMIELKRELKEEIAVIRAGVFASTWASAGIKNYLVEKGLADEEELKETMKRANASLMLDEFLDEKAVSTETKKTAIH